MDNKIYFMVLLWLYFCTTKVKSESCLPQSGVYIMHNGSCVANNTYFRAITLNGEGNGLHCLAADTAAQPKWFFPNGSHIECGVDYDRFFCTMNSNNSTLIYTKSTVIGDDQDLDWVGVYSCCLFGICSSNSSNRVTARIFDTVYITDFSVTLPESVALIPQKYTVHCLLEDFADFGNIPFIVYHMEGRTISYTSDNSYCEQFPGVTCIHKHNPTFVSVTETPVIDSQLNVTWDASTVTTTGKYFTFDNSMNGDHDIRCQSAYTDHADNSAYITIRAPNFNLSTPSMCVNNATSVTIDWTLPSSSPDADGYVIYYKSGIGPDMSVKVDGGSVSQYTLGGLVPNSMYTITLRAYQDILGPTSDSANVTITNAAPGPVSDVAVDAVTSSSITLQWSPPSTNICIINFFITYSVTCPGTSETHSGSVMVSADHTSYQFQSLKGNQQYAFNISVKSPLGDSSNITIHGTTENSAPSAPPQNVSAKAVSYDKVQVTWGEVPCLEHNGDITGFYINVTINGTSVNNTSVGISGAFAVTGLFPLQTYTISVAAVNEEGTGPHSSPAVVKTPLTIPGPVVSIQVTVVDATTVTLSWSTPDTLGPLIDSYHIQYTTSCEGQVINISLSISNETNTVNLTGLEEGQNYTFDVRARNSVGDGETVSTWLVTQSIVPGDHPTNIVITTSESDVNISWEHLECFSRNGAITGYIISVTGEGTSENKTSNTTNIEINELMNFTPYNISVAAVNEIGEGPFSHPQIVTIRGAVGSVNVSSQGPTWMLVTWTEPSNTATGITQYEVAYSLSVSCSNGVIDETGTKILTVPASVISRNVTGLHADTCYMISVRANSLYGPGEWTTIHKRTAILPVVPTNTEDLTTPTLSSSGSVESTSSSFGLVVGGVLTSVIVVLLAFMLAVLVVIIVIRKSRTKRFPVKDDTLQFISSQNEMSSLPMETQYAGVGPILSINEPFADDELTHTYAEPPDEYIYAFIPSKTQKVIFDHLIPPTLPVLLSRLGRHVAKCHTNENQAFLQQFKELYSGEEKSSVVAFASDKKQLNRFKNIGPYDDNMVVLKPLEHDGCEREYMNASFVDGFSTAKKFIATQGPLKSTVTDFWRMIWQEHPQSIVMVTNLTEGAKSKCEQYWPSSQFGHQKFGPFTVTLLDEQVLPDIVIRKMRVWLAEDSTNFHPITQYHFVSWPDHGVPIYPTPLVSLHKRVMTGWNPEGGPIVVHCSAGVGRTGTFIAMDLALEQADRKREVDIAGITNRLRQQRMKMVQTEDQYVFVHDVVLEVLLCGNTEVPSSTFAKHLGKMKLTNSRTGKSEFETQFELLAQVTPDPTTVLCKTAVENMDKNRAKKYLPVDRWRVILYGEHPGYIHASFIKGYKTKKAFIIAQSPMNNTVRDFWKMVIENKVSTIVMLSPQHEENNEVCFQYWGTAPNSLEKFGEYYVGNKAVMEKEQLIKREMSVHKDEMEIAKHHLTQFQILNWPADGQVRETSTILEVIEEVIRAQQRGGRGPVVVHCSDTVSRSGVYCAVSNALEQCKVEGVVDVFQAVKAIRMQKPGAVTSVEQYESIFQLVNNYLSMYETYANFQ